MKELKPALLLFLIFTIICGGIYPLAVTGIAHALFPARAGGSFISDKEGKVVGSSLIGQPFSDPKYFWPRPSATPDFGCNPLGSGGSNLGPTNPDYLKTISDRVKTLRNSGITGSIPTDLAQASASGLDPHISPEAAMLQAARVARSRNVSEAVVLKAVQQAVEDRQFGILGAPRVNVLVLNLEMDRLMKP